MENRMIKREPIEWCDIWMEDAHESPKPRLLMVGDSITRSYYPHVQKQLSGDFACARLATSKCVADPGFVRELDLVLADVSFSVIHFNNGLHGWDYPDETFGTHLAEVMDKLIGCCGVENLIWGTITPVWTPNDLSTLDAKTERVRERNRLAEGIVRERGLAVNDLFTAVLPHPEVFAPDGIHFQEAGQKILAESVVTSIRKL